MSTDGYSSDSGDALSVMSVSTRFIKKIIHPKTIFK